MHEEQTILVLPLLQEETEYKRIDSEGHQLQEMAITGCDNSGKALDAASYLQVLEDLRRIHRSTVAAISQVLAAALHTHHYRIDHPGITGQRVFIDSRVLSWGTHTRTVGALFSEVSRCIPPRVIADSIPTPKVSSEGHQTDAQIVEKALTHLRQCTGMRLVFVCEQMGISDEAWRTMNLPEPPEIKIYSPSDVARHFLEHRKRQHSFPIAEEEFLLEAIAVAGI